MSTQERVDALAFVRERFSEVRADDVPQIFSVSAHMALDAKLRGDDALLRKSGIVEFEQELVRFLISGKSTDILLRTCDRLTELLYALPKSSDIVPLLKRIKKFSGEIAGESATASPVASLEFREPQTRQIGPCEACEAIVERLFAFFSLSQYELSASDEAREAHAQRGGFCGFHTWQYESVASPQGIAIGYAPLLIRLSGWFREHAMEPLDKIAEEIGMLLPSQATCAACAIRMRAESETIVAIASRLETSAEHDVKPNLCLAHLQSVVAAVDDAGISKVLLEHEAATLAALADNMQRFVLNHDALRRALLTDEEIRSPLHTLTLLAGAHRVNAPAIV